VEKYVSIDHFSHQTDTIIEQGYIMNAMDMTGVAKNAENYLKMTLAEISYAERTLGCSVIAWCTDASGESHKMWKLLHKQQPSMIVVDCWSHQVSNLTKTSALY
jgi:hypothetical protein